MKSNATRLVDEYPLGKAFLDGPARLSADALHAHCKNTASPAIMQRGWEVPFYRRHWASAGIEPGDIKGLERPVETA